MFETKPMDTSSLAVSTWVRTRQPHQGVTRTVNETWGRTESRGIATHLWSGPGVEKAGVDASSRGCESERKASHHDRDQHRGRQDGRSRATRRLSLGAAAQPRGE